MTKSRMEAFSDGVLAIAVTIMVLEMKVPHGPTFEALKDLLPVFISYVLSFVYLGIYWNNHHHLLQAANRVNGSILWANLHLLFWLSLVPFATGWLGETGFASAPVALYGCVLLGAALAYMVLAVALQRHHGPGSDLQRASGGRRKEAVSLLLYALAVGMSASWPMVSCGIYALVAAMWLVPDRRIERIVA